MLPPSIKELSWEHLYEHLSWSGGAVIPATIRAMARKVLVEVFGEVRVKVFVSIERNIYIHLSR